MADQQPIQFPLDDLLERGFKMGNGYTTQYERVIEGFEGQANPPVIALTKLRNAPEFAFFTGSGNGTIIYLNPKSLDDLDVLARMIVDIDLND